MVKDVADSRRINSNVLAVMAAAANEAPQASPSTPKSSSRMPLSPRTSGAVGMELDGEGGSSRILSPASK